MKTKEFTGEPRVVRKMALKFINILRLKMDRVDAKLTIHVVSGNPILTVVVQYNES